MTLKYTPISEVGSRIGCTDARAAVKRCNEMGIKVHTLNKRKYVIEEDFNREMELKYIDILKQKYPNRYKEIYLAIKKDDYLLVHELVGEEYDINGVGDLISNGYKAQGDAAKNFLKKIYSYDKTTNTKIKKDSRSLCPL